MQFKLNKIIFIAFIIIYILCIGCSSAVPQLAAIGNKNVIENQPLIFTISARDNNTNAPAPIYSAEGLPSGSTLNQNTGAFVWNRPVAGTYSVNFIASSNGQRDSERITITVQKTAVVANKDALRIAIANAINRVNSAPVGTGANQYPQSAVNVFQNAINAAQQVVNNPRATQDSVNNALSSLNNSISIFTQSINTNPVGDKTSLANEITIINTKLAVASAGGEIGQYPQTAINNLRSVLVQAQNVMNKPTATQQEIDGMLATLRSAENTFDSAKITTTNRNDLKAVIDIANSKINTATSGTNTGQYPQAAIDTCRTALATAQAVYSNPGSSQTQINQTINDLKAAIAIFDSAIVSDAIPPASITGLNANNVTSTSITWGWNNPNDPDFKEVRIYINGAFVTATSNNNYISTGLSDSTEYTISTRTVDQANNINPAWVNATANTGNMPKILTVNTINAYSNSITLSWTTSDDVNTIKLMRGEVLLGNITGTKMYSDSGLESNKTYTYLLTPYNDRGVAGSSVSFEAKTTVSDSGNNGGGGGSSSSGSSSSGGGATAPADSGENTSNIILKDTSKLYLTIDMPANYTFKATGNDILAVNFTSLKNSGEITTTIEMLKNRSKFAGTVPEGLLYRYNNIWVGMGSFSNSENIKNASVKFRVNSSWIQQNGLKASDIKLQRYNGTAWQILPTVSKGNISGYEIFEATTPGFSPFALTGTKNLTASNITNVDTTPEKVTNPLIWTLIMAMLIIALIVVGYQYTRK